MRPGNSEPAGASISLFPFLAVLICTMGVMITLLVIASKATDEHHMQANAEANRELAAAAEQLEFELQSSELKVDVLLRSRPQLQERLQQARLRRSHVEDELRKMEQQFNDVVARGKALARKATPPPEINDSELEALRQQLDAAERKLQTASQRRQVAPASYAIVAHPSIHGTLRRPIYVECRESSIVLQPTGVVIRAEELTKPILPGNALDTALLATREYWRQNDLQGSHGEPYPLLVVRPDGAHTYALARQAMQSWNDEFGYELVEAEKNINYGSPDRALANVLQRAIDGSRPVYAEGQRNARTANSVHYAGQNGGGSADGGLRVSRNGGFEMIGGSADEPDSDATTPLASDQTAGRSEKQGHQSHATGNIKGAPSHGQAGLPNSEPSALMGVAPIADSRGANWALPSKNSGATAYRRPITVYCDAEVLTIDGGRGSNARQEIEFKADAASVDRFIGAIWQIIETWGLAERNGYWRPELRFVVYPTGQTTFQQIQILLRDCGFDVLQDSDR